MAKLSAPMPSLPTATADSGLEQAAKIGGGGGGGGCGCWTGRGIPWVGGTLKNLPWYSNTSCCHMRGIMSSASSHCSCSLVTSFSKASCSVSDELLPEP